MNYTATQSIRALRLTLATKRSPALALGIALLGLGAAPAAPPAVAPPKSAPATNRAQAGAAPPPAAVPADAEFPNVPTAGLMPSERDTLKRLLSKFPSACGKPHSLLTSLRTDPQCKMSVVTATWTAKLIGNGHLESEVEEKYDHRFNKCYQVDVSGAQVYGDAAAPITLVEFADFECPHCAMTDPVIKQLVEQHPKKLKWVFMNYPIPMHPNAANAAAAALAAGKQGKFWEFKSKLFKNQGSLTPLHIEQYAQEMGLNLTRFKTDLETLRSRVHHEREVGEKLDLSGTPTLYINCRKVEGTPTLENLNSYVEAELSR